MCGGFSLRSKPPHKNKTTQTHFRYGLRKKQQDMEEIIYDRFITKEWLDKIKKLPDPLTMTISTHLMTEYGINYLIQENVINPKSILKNRDFTFSIKLEICFQNSLIPEYLYNNIRKLNKIRNKYAHQLNADDISNWDLDFIDIQKRCNLNDYKKKENIPKSTNDILAVIVWIGLFTFGELHKLILDKYLKDIID